MPSFGCCACEGQPWDQALRLDHPVRRGGRKARRRGPPRLARAVYRCTVVFKCVVFSSSDAGRSGADLLTAGAACGSGVMQLGNLVKTRPLTPSRTRQWRATDVHTRAMIALEARSPGGAEPNLAARLRPLPSRSCGLTRGAAPCACLATSPTDRARRPGRHAVKLRVERRIRSGCQRPAAAVVCL
jgi:hypothetical protein